MAPIGRILQQAGMDTANTLKTWRAIMQTHLVDRILSPGTLDEISKICTPEVLQGIKNAAFLWAFGGENNPQKDDIATITNINYRAHSLEQMMSSANLSHPALQSLANYPTALVTPSPNNDGTWVIQVRVLSDSQAFTATPSNNQVIGFQTLSTYLQNGQLSVNSPGFKTRQGLTLGGDDQELNNTAGSAYFLSQSRIDAAQAARVNRLKKEAYSFLKEASSLHYSSWHQSWTFVKEDTNAGISAMKEAYQKASEAFAKAALIEQNPDERFSLEVLSGIVSNLDFENATSISEPFAQGLSQTINHPSFKEGNVTRAVIGNLKRLGNLCPEVAEQVSATEGILGLVAGNKEALTNFRSGSDSQNDLLYHFERTSNEEGREWTKEINSQQICSTLFPEEEWILYRDFEQFAKSFLRERPNQST